jgi:LacI family transcriptional regulator, repressor for deo operon, udp, cdd, tsx, nupC, and nupG
LQEFAGLGGGLAMAGIVEIAKKAGVSPATVSRALRGIHHVNEKTRKKIVDAARDLDYPIRPDLLPRGANEKTNTIGVIAPFISQSISGVEQALREAGLDLLLYNFAQVDARERVLMQKKLVDKVDGLIVISLPPSEKEFERLLNLGIPVSLLGIASELCSSVSIDDVKGGRIATQHLVDMGHRDIAIMTGQKEPVFDFRVANQRLQGYMEVLQENDIEFNPRNELYSDFTSATSEIAMEEFLTRKKLPTAIFCESDEMAFGVFQAMRKKGLRVPEDISIVGYDGHDFGVTLGLTTVAQPVRFLGQLAASQVMALIEKPESVVSQMVVPTELVQRQSVLKIN